MRAQEPRLLPLHAAIRRLHYRRCTEHAYGHYPPMDRPRYLEPAVREDLAAKMLFIAGPRQVGKTTLARRIMGSAAGTADRRRPHRFRA